MPSTQSRNAVDLGQICMVIGKETTKDKGNEHKTKTQKSNKNKELLKRK